MLPADFALKELLPGVHFDDLNVVYNFVDRVHTLVFHLHHLLGCLRFQLVEPEIENRGQSEKNDPENAVPADADIHDHESGYELEGEDRVLHRHLDYEDFTAVNRDVVEQIALGE